MSWVFLLIIAYFFVSLTALADKFLLSKTLPHAIVYVFYITLLSLASVFLAPLGFNIPNPFNLLISFVAGVSFTVGMYFLFTSLQRSEASRVFAAVGALGASFTFIFSFWFLNERLGLYPFIGFALLVIGGIFVSIEYSVDKKLGETGFWFSLLTGIFFGVAYTATKHIYDDQGFISGFIWIRLFSFVGLLLFLFSKKDRGYLKHSLSRQAPIRQGINKYILLGGQASSAVGFLILNYVISLSSPAIVLAAQGLQYAFLFVVGLILTKWHPHIIEEKITWPVVLQKTFSIIVICAGLAIISFIGA
ncbi:MAG: DMT family transporter [Candidatus Buchananbacteria bacterium]|nr:DMT family transporter [Candidatus Buchananbacteria bacterium]